MKEKIIRNKQYYLNRLAHLLPMFHFEGKTILDVGCGEMLLKSFVMAQGGQYLGIDHNFQHTDTHFIPIDLFTFSPPGSSTFDYVFCLGVLDHLSDDGAVHAFEKYAAMAKIGFVFSLCNPSCVIAGFLSCKKKIGLDRMMRSNKILPLSYLLKIPLSQKLFNINKKTPWKKYLASEIIYYFNANESIL